MVGWVYVGSRHEVPDVGSGKEVPDRGVTDPPRPELVEAGGRSVAGLIAGVTAPPRPELFEAGGRSMAGKVLGKEVLEGGVIDPHWPDPRSRWEEGAWPDESSRREVMSSR